MRPIDVSPDWKGSSKKEQKIIEFLIGLQETPEAITAAAKRVTVLRAVDEPAMRLQVGGL